MPDKELKRGRPRTYKPEYVEQALKLGKLGLTDVELGVFFEVSIKTIERWKQTYSDFCLALKNGRSMADAEVASKLYHRAVGYEHPDVHISNFQGEITATPIVKHYPPDTVACIFWLKNRQKEKWREKAAEPTEKPEESAKLVRGLIAALMATDDKPA